MLARLQKCITLGLLAGAMAWLLLFWPGQPVCAVAGALVAVFGFALVLGLEFAIVPFIHGADPAPRAGTGQLFRAWWGEVLTAPRVFFWRQPFRSEAVPDHLPAGASGRGVVFIHGMFCNRGFWTPWTQRLRFKNTAFVAVNLEPPWGSIDAYAAVVDAAVQRVTEATGLPPVLICHSMGGLAARAWMRTAGAECRVHRVITIATPHAGTWMARFSHSLNGVQMRRESAWLAQLSQDAQAVQAGWQGRFVCWYSNADNIVCPASTAALPGADNRFVAGAAHVALAFHPRVMRDSLAMVGLD